MKKLTKEKLDHKNFLRSFRDAKKRKYYFEKGLSNKDWKKMMIKRCYLVIIYKDGAVSSIQTFSEKYPTVVMGEGLIHVMKTKGSSYGKAFAAMKHCLRINRRYNWMLPWINDSWEAHMNKPQLWEKARNGEIRIEHLSIESKIPSAYAEG